MVEGVVLGRIEIRGGIGGRRITIAREIVIGCSSSSRTTSSSSSSSSGGGGSGEAALLTGRSTEIRPSGVCFWA